jgi:hypothetical protein
MSPDDQENLRKNDEMLMNMMMADPEAEKIKSETSKHLDEV